MNRPFMVYNDLQEYKFKLKFKSKAGFGISTGSNPVSAKRGGVAQVEEATEPHPKLKLLLQAEHSLLNTKSTARDSILWMQAHLLPDPLEVSKFSF